VTGFRDPPTIDIDTDEADRFVGQLNTVVRLPSSESSSALSLLSQARMALEKAATIDVVKEIRDQAEALRIYAKQAQQSFEMQNHCAEIKIRAERKAGLMLLEQDKNKGAAAPAEERDGIPRLRELGISYSQSSRWQSMAGIPEETFEIHLDRLKEANQEITNAIFLKLAAKLAKERNQANSESERADSVEDMAHLEATDQPHTTDFKKAIEALRGLILRLRKTGWQPVTREEIMTSLRYLLELVEAEDRLD